MAKPDDNSLIHICGPTGFNKWVKNEGLNQGWTLDQIKEELFSIEHTDSLEAKPFEVVLNKSRKVITVDEDASIINTLLMNNIKVDYTCLQGIYTYSILEA